MLILRMVLKDFMPAPALRDLVRCYRIVHMTFDATVQLAFKPYTPRPENCLAFYPLDLESVDFTDAKKTATKISVALVGQALSVTNRHIGHNFMVVQILFQPGGLYRLTGMPAFEVTNDYIEADAVFSKDVHLVNEAFFHAKSYTEMVEIADNFIADLRRKKQRDAHPTDLVCQQMMVHPNPVLLDKLAKNAFLSVKQFERKFKERTGVNPKTFERLIRFDRAFREKNLTPDRDWQRIAFDCQYYDYQHLVRDYKTFTGQTPTAFHQLEIQAPERILGMAEHYYETAM
jgi:AraC-like DNA-binding protein